MTTAKLNLQNKKALFEFEILEKFTAGIVLTGTEIKSVREGKVNFSDSFCTFKEGELFIYNLHIAEYSHASFYSHEPKRPRKLLLQKRELRKLNTKVKEKGLTIVPLRMYFSETGFAKIDIGLARGKKLHDKRETIKDRDVKREMSRSGD